MPDDPAVKTRARGSYWAVLRQRDFALFFVAASASTLGSAVVPVALTFALLALKYSATTIGLVLAAQTAPAVVLMLLGGVAGDRWPRRRVMIAADILRCAAQAALGGNVEYKVRRIGGEIGKEGGEAVPAIKKRM